MGDMSMGVLLPCDVMDSADHAVAKCLSVCLSHADILSKRLYIIIIKLFPPSGSHTFRLFIARQHTDARY